VGGRASRKPLFDLSRQVLVGSMHVAELGIAERAAGTHRDPDGMEHAGERDFRAVGHIGMPTLARVGEPRRLAVHAHVGQHHDFRKTRRVKLIGDVDFKLAKGAAKARKLFRIEPLIGEAKHAVCAKRAQDLLEVTLRERLRKINAFDGCA